MTDEPKQDGGHGSRKSAEECVRIHLPNGLAPKMDGAQACGRYLTTIANIRNNG